MSHPATNGMKTAKNLIITVLTSAVLVVAIGLVFSSASGDAVIPRQFFDAKIGAANASKNLMRLMDDSLTNLNKVNELERERAFSPALEIVNF